RSPCVVAVVCVSGRKATHFPPGVRPLRLLPGTNPGDNSPFAMYLANRLVFSVVSPRSPLGRLPRPLTRVRASSKGRAMPAPTVIDEFLDLTYKSGVLSKDAFTAYWKRLEDSGKVPQSPKELAEAMIRDGLLTKFQADHLLQGKWRGFIIAGKYRLL